MQGEPTDRERTSAQNRALHKYLRQVSVDLDNAGYTVDKVIKMPIQFTEYNVKEYMFRPVAEVMFGKGSSTELTVDEMREVVDQLQMLFAAKFGITTPFPSKEES